MPTLTVESIHAARRFVAARVRRTPLAHSTALSARIGAQASLKLETLQETGSFKLRGAINRLAVLGTAERARGVVAVSTGNHGRAVAHAARQLGIPAVVFLSSLTPENKVVAIRELGAEVRIVGHSQDEAEVAARELAAGSGMTMVHPFDDPLVIGGQGTIGLELIEDAPDVDTVVVPLSGGGLIGGIALALTASDRPVRVVGVSMERGPAMHASQKAGRPVEVEEMPSLADSLGGGIGLDNQYTFALVRDLVDEIVLVDENEIADALWPSSRLA